MLIYALTAFAIAAAVGATLAYLRIVKKDVSMPLALIHGLFAATGLVLLIVAFSQIGGKVLTIDLALFVLAALGGFTLFSYHLRSRPMPVPLVLVHGAAAIVAFLILVAAKMR
jgi:uncharacterized membrane protein (UPF0136 family)